MSERTTITQEWAGSQPRAYAGDLWEGTIEYEYKVGGEWKPWDRVTKEHVQELVKFLTGYKDRTEDSDWFVPRLLELNTKGEMHVWHYRVERPYDD